MAKVGLLAPDARVELIEGVTVDMPPIGSRHAAIVDRWLALLVSAAGSRAIVRCQGPIQLGDDSEPQPDLTLLRQREDYDEHAATADDALLIIEVSETTLRADLQTKMPLYARHSVPELWVLDLHDNQLHVFRRPTSATYSESFCIEKLGLMPIGSLPGVTVDLSSLIR